MWLHDAPDTTAWKMESFGKNELGKVPLGDLPDALQDIVGEMLKQNKDLQEAGGGLGLQPGRDPDGVMGWDIADGPMPSWAAKGKSGNTAPNDNEQTGRSGSGRQGKSEGEIVGGHRQESLKGAEGQCHAGTNDAFQAGQLKEEQGGSAMDTKATGGGKLARCHARSGEGCRATPRPA